MSDDTRQSAPSPTARSEADPLRELRHDLRHSLYVLDLALTLLGESRSDEARFSEVLQMLRNEQGNINRLVEQLLTRVSSKPSAESGPADRENFGQ
jgi:signal transduction histidine kinase